MNDFLKIFLVLCGLVGTFVFGRNYGENTVLESRDQKQMQKSAEDNERAQAELFAIKEKFQDLLDGTDLRKADELVNKTMTILLADLSLHLSDEKTKEMSALRQVVATCMNTTTAKQTTEPQRSTAEAKPATDAGPKQSLKDNKKYKSFEWMLLNAQGTKEIKKALKKVEIKNLKTFLKDAPASTFEQTQKFSGAYRGTVTDVTNKSYGSLIVELRPSKNDANEDMFKGRIELLRNGKQESNSTFHSKTLGLMPTDLGATIVSLGNRQVQLYKIESSQQLAGYFYEQLPNGTTNTIGHFVLNRVDQF